MILVYGSLNVDLIYRLSEMARPGQTVLADSMTTEPGGKGANQAVAAALDGAVVAMVGTVGEDAMATTALAGLIGAGVDVTGVARSAAPTGSACICIDAAGQNQIVVASGANGDTRSAQVATSSLADVSILLTQMETDPESTAALIRRGHAQGIRCIHNLAPAMPMEADVLRLLEILVVNEEEGVWLAAHLGAAMAGDALSLHRLLGITVVRTLGAGGVEWAGDDAQGHLPAAPVTVADTTAAGDCFVGVLAAALDRGASLGVAIRRAATAATLACTRAGSQRSLPDSPAIDTALPSRV
jgi:ribokinase